MTNEPVCRTCGKHSTYHLNDNLECTNCQFMREYWEKTPTAEQLITTLRALHPATRIFLFDYEHGSPDPVGELEKLKIDDSEVAIFYHG